jgi:plasmid replication initiation protein
VIEAGYQLSLNEQRVILAAIGLVDPRKELLVTDRFELSAKDFCTLFDVSEKNAYKALIDVSERLFSRYVVIQKPDANWDKLKTHWISSIRYNKSSGKIAISFASDIIPYLSQLKGSFTRYELKHIGNMTSTYGVRLYELLIQWKNKGGREVEIAWLKKQFQIEDKYNSIKDLKKYVIEPAIKDINTHSNLTVSWEQRKTGRAVTHLIFTFSEKKQTQEEKEAARITERDAERQKLEREILEDIFPRAKLTDNDYETMGYELMSASADTTQEPDDKPPKTDITITLTDEQLKCFEWAKNHDHWKKYTRNKKSFLTCFNKMVEGGLKDQWLATLTATPKEKMILGVPMSEIDKQARGTESYEQAAARINREKDTKKPPAPIKPEISLKEYENSRLEVIKAFVANKKEDLLKEFAVRGCVSNNALGTIIEHDLRLAGLFD